MKKIVSLFFTWKVPISSREELAKAAVIITHEFGDQIHLSRTTSQIAHLGVLLSKNLNIPLCSQYPGDSIASESKIQPLLIIKEHRLKPYAYLDTQEVQRQVAELCQKNGWEKVIVCAHPDHAWRAGENLKKFGLVPLYPNLSTIQYDSHCPRFTLSSKYIFIPREILARIVYYLKGWI